MSTARKILIVDDDEDLRTQMKWALAGDYEVVLAGDRPEALEKAVRSMHERGVAHLDLRHRSNVLVSEDGAPILIDFASAICFKPGGAAARWILPFLASVDLRAVEKWRDRLASEPTRL